MTDEPEQPMRLIDSHAHLTDERFDEDRHETLARAVAAGIEAVVVIGYNVESSYAVADLVGSSAGSVGPELYGTVGFAPHNVAEAGPAARAEVRELLSRRRIVAVGEIGLDYHYDMPPDDQRDLFGEQLRWAVEHRLPVVVHSREAEEDVVAMIRDAAAHDGTVVHDGTAAEDGVAAGGGAVADGTTGRDRVRGVIHCFTESERMATAVVELGLYVSFSGILTFRNAEDLRRAAALVPLERTLIETDAPYLAPVPHRGRRNEPAFVGAVAECLATVHGVDVEEVAAVTTANSRSLFGL